MGRQAHTFVWKLSLLAILVFGVTVPSRAQTFYGSILGTISDSAGAVVPGATITLTNQGTSETRTVQTETAGNYRFVNLIPGNYRIDVEKEGFKRVSRPDIVVLVQNDVRIDVTLEVGQLVQTVEVKAQTPLLQTDSAALGQVITSPEQMPLNGRNIMALTALVPGVIAQGTGSTELSPAIAGSGGWDNYQINGGLADENAGFLDGGPINMNYIDSFAFVPTQDAIAEFKVQTNNLSAEWGRFSGGVVNLTSKSGTNAYHGTMYDYLRNTKLNANTFFANKSGLAVVQYNQNQFGGNLGGPIMKNKLFFFANYEGFRYRKGATTTTTVPTAAMRTGDFTASGIPTIYDALTTCGAAQTPGQAAQPACAAGVAQYTRQSFASEYGAGNVVPNGTNIVGVASEINPVANIMQNDIYPLPDVSGILNNWVYNYVTGNDNDQYNGRIDANLSDKQHAFGRFTLWEIYSRPSYPYTTNMKDPNAAYSHQLAGQVVLADTYSINPTTVADIHVSWLRYDLTSPKVSAGIDATMFGFPAYMNTLGNRMSPQPVISGFGGFSGSSGIIVGRNMNYDAIGSITKIKGVHTLKAGFESRKMDDGYIQTNYPSGEFSFSSSFTSLNPNNPTGGYAYASYLLGYGSGGAWEDAPTTAHEWYNALYLNDTWQITHRLTLDLGIRYDIPFGWEEKYNRLCVLQPNAVNLLSTAALPLSGDAALVGSTLYPDTHEFTDRWTQFAPRFGLAYRAPRNFVIRGGYGVFYLPQDAIFQTAPFNDPVVNYTQPWNGSLVTGVPNLSAPFNNPFPNGIIFPLGDNPAALQSYLEGTGVSAPIPTDTWGYYQQWNFNVEKELSPGTMLEVAYAGSRGVHVPRVNGFLDQLPDADLAKGTALQTQVANPFYGEISSVLSLGAPTIAASQLLRPYPEYSSVYNVAAPTGDTNYQALYIKFQKRFQSAGSILASYTWSKWMTNVETSQAWNENGQGNTTAVLQDPEYNRRADWAPSSNDIPHNLVVSYTLGLPFGQGKKFAGGVTGALGKFVSGWGINGIYTLQSGNPLIWAENSSTLPGSSGEGAQRPNLVAGCNPSYSSAQANRLGGSTEPLTWFNTACFTQPAAFTYGNSAREFANVRQSGVNNGDFALFKDTKITERMTLQFRAEFFNMWNRVQFSVPGTAQGATTFGVVSGQENQPRCEQFALRLNF